MSLSDGFRPTLLVGVGGTGSKIAEQILRQIEENDPELIDRIGIMAIDTDTNDLRSLKFVPKQARVQIARPETVYRLLERNSEIESDWCYARNDLQMTEDVLELNPIIGAGQIRMITRAALYDQFKSGNLMNTLEMALADLAVHSDEQAYDGAVRVLVLGSLAGATGSGSFAAIALALKQAAKNRGISAIVRGVFMLPDVYARSGALEPDKWPNVLANGYASLKELNAFNVRARMNQQRSSNFRFEFAPGHELMDGSTPYATVTFIDYENTGGGTMGRNLDSYTEMAARAGYLLVFTPLGDRNDSRDVNNTLKRLEGTSTGDSRLFSGIGVAAAKYPIESMRRFLVRRLIQDNLRGDWTRLDASYRNQLARFQEDEKAGMTGSERPDIRDTYLRDIKQLSEEEPRMPFFRKVQDFMFPVEEDERTGEQIVKSRHLTFADAVADHVRRAFWSETDMASISRRNAIDSSSLLESDSLEDSVRRGEAELDRDFRTIEAGLQSRPADIYQNSLVSADGAGKGEWAMHHVQSHIIEENPHPVAARGFLYQVRAELAARRDAIDPRDLKLKLFRLANEYREEEEIQSTKNRPNTRSTSQVIERASKSAEGSVMGKIFGGNKKAFATDYAEYYNKSLRSMSAYANGVIDQKTYDQALGEIDSLIRTYEGLFSEIATISSEIETEIEAEKTAYEGKAGFDGNSYIYADSACKEDAWARLSSSAASLNLGDEVNRALNTELHDHHREDRRKRRQSGFKQVNKLFRDVVIGGFAEQALEQDFSHVFDISVIEAMQRQIDVHEDQERQEAARAGNAAPRSRPAAERLRSIVDRVAQQSSPYLSFTDPDGGQNAVKFWTVHEQCKKDLNDEALFLDMFKAQDGDEPLLANEFSKHELICVSLRTNVALTELSKLQLADKNATNFQAMTDGRMTAYYDERIKRMLDSDRSSRLGAEFTPHLDKNWHLPGVLPEIFAGQDDKIAGDNSKGYAIALLHQLLQPDTEGETAVTRFSNKGMGLRASISDVVTNSHDPWKIRQAFTSKVQFVNGSVDYWNLLLEEEAGKLETHPSYKTLTDPARLLMLLHPAQVRSATVQERDDSVTADIEAWMDLLEQLIETQETSLSPNAQKSRWRKEVRAARDTVLNQARSEGYPPEVVRIFEDRIDTAFDAAVHA